jgi:hypothetical protein
MFYLLLVVAECGRPGMEAEVECAVCGTRTRTTGLHYGAVTCYPCRAFFRSTTRSLARELTSGRRRVPERRRPPLCKRGGSCRVDPTVTKHCPGCRFQKCLRFLLYLSTQNFPSSLTQALSLGNPSQYIQLIVKNCPNKYQIYDIDIVSTYNCSGRGCSCVRC